MTRASLLRSPKRTAVSRTKLVRRTSLALLLLAEQRASAQLCTSSSPGGPNCTICTATHDAYGSPISGVCDGTYSGGYYGTLCALRLPRPPRPATSAPATSPSARLTRARTR